MQSEIKQVSRQIVLELRNRPGYGFLDEEEFVATVYSQASQSDECYRAAKTGADLTKPISRVAKNVYSHAIYDGCRSRKIKEQQRAYKELSYYLYRITSNYVMSKGCSLDLAEECAQQALMQIHKNIETVRKPGGFLAFTITTTNRICFRMIEKARRYGECGEALPEPNEGHSLITPELLDCLLEAIARLSNKDMRMVLTLEYFANFKDREIALVVHTTTNNIQQLRFRAKKVMRDDQELLECLQNG